MDGFRMLSEAFKKAVEKIDLNDIATRGVRTLGAAGEAGAKKAAKEFPQDYISGIVNDIYATITSQDVAEGISLTVRSFDHEKAQEVMDKLVAKLKDDETALKIAEGLKQALQQTSPDELAAMIGEVVGKLPGPMGQFGAFLPLILAPVLQTAQHGTVEELAQEIKDLADQIPTDFIAANLGGLTQEVSPERVTKVLHDAVGKLPSGSTIASIKHGVFDLTAERFGAISKAKTLQDAAQAFGGFANDVTKLVGDKLAADSVTKQKFGKKGGDFDL